MNGWVKNKVLPPELILYSNYSIYNVNNTEIEREIERENIHPKTLFFTHIGATRSSEL